MAHLLTRTDERANALGVGLHDSRLVGLVYEVGSVLALRLSRLDGRLATVSLRGIGPVGFVGVRNGAIVSSLFMWAPVEAALSNATARSAWRTLFGDDIGVDALPSAVDPIVKEDQFRRLVFLACSYGGAIAALCQEVDFEVD